LYLLFVFLDAYNKPIASSERVLTVDLLLHGSLLDEKTKYAYKPHLWVVAQHSWRRNIHRNPATKPIQYRLKMGV